LLQEKIINQKLQNNDPEFQKSNSDENLENLQEIVKSICSLIINVLKETKNADHIMSPVTKNEFSNVLKDFIFFLKRSFKFQLMNQTIQIQTLKNQLQIVDDKFDYFNKEKLYEYFKNKQLIKIDKYIEYLNGIFWEYTLEG
jgi:predicted house-cleaning noncanonical NTP pyrophosphatase (MazG superfamily)